MEAFLSFEKIRGCDWQDISGTDTKFGIQMRGWGEGVIDDVIIFFNDPIELKIGMETKFDIPNSLYTLNVSVYHIPREHQKCQYWTTALTAMKLLKGNPKA